MMTTTKQILAALAVILGTTAIVAPAMVTAQDATVAPETAPAETPAPGPMADMGKGRGGMAFDFTAMDADKDGKVTEAEIAAYRAAQIAGLDADGNGLISAAEMTAQIEKQMSERAADMAAKRIAAQDVDGDGSLSVEELASRPVPADMFDRVDTDGDGAITRAEADAAEAKMRDRFADMRDGGGKGWGKRHGRHGGGDDPAQN
jgi:EF hand